jgi:putative ABC transport system ATP-binding protein
MNLYEAHNLSRRYDQNGHRVPALRGLSLRISQGEFVAIAGPSGSGKTTLLNLLGLLDFPDEGSLRFEDQDTAGLNEHQRTWIRRQRIGFIFQSLNLIPVLTSYENIEYFLLKRKVPRSEIRKRVTEALACVGLADKAEQRANTLSGGERQRVAIARALARNVDVVLADEPTAALDQATAHAIVDLMKRLNRERGMTFLFATHDPGRLAAAERVVRLADGRSV